MQVEIYWVQKDMVREASSWLWTFDVDSGALTGSFLNLVELRSDLIQGMRQVFQALGLIE